MSNSRFSSIIPSSRFHVRVFKANYYCPSTYSRTHCDGSHTIFSYYTLTTGMFYVITLENYRPYNTFCERGFFRWLQVASINYYKCGLFVFFSRFVNTFFININVFFYRNFHDYLNKYLEV